MTLMGLPEASRRTGRARLTLDAWIERGWLRTEEVRDGRGVRHFVTIEAIREAELTAATAPKEPVRVWVEAGVGDRIIPAQGTKQHARLRHWLKFYGVRILH